MNQKFICLFPKKTPLMLAVWEYEHVELHNCRGHHAHHSVGEQDFQEVVQYIVHSLHCVGGISRHLRGLCSTHRLRTQERKKDGLRRDTSFHM